MSDRAQQNIDKAHETTDHNPAVNKLQLMGNNIARAPALDQLHNGNMQDCQGNSDSWGNRDHWGPDTANKQSIAPVLNIDIDHTVCLGGGGPIDGFSWYKMQSVTVGKCLCQCTGWQFLQ